MELSANVWPVVDVRTGLILRYLIRAYAIDGPDEVIGATLRALAPTDFRMATVFRIPERFAVVSEHGTLTRCVTIGDFRKHQSAILEPAFKELEKSYNQFQGIVEPVRDGPITAIAAIPRFPAQPYLLITSLIEMPDGQLVPKVRT
jgi:hypothetical protein